MKSTVEEIRRRFDHDVERFSNLTSGQTATVDAALVLDLVSQAAKAATPHASDLLDVGCGAGNYTLKLLEKFPQANATLIDLSKPMLARAHARTKKATSGVISTKQNNIRALDLPDQSIDIITAAAVLHHLRDDTEWEMVFKTFYNMLRPGGSLWISDLVEHNHAAIQQMMWKRYGTYLKNLKDEAYRKKVFAYIKKEDTPKSLPSQLNLLQSVGFSTIEVLHKNNCFAAFGAIK